MHQEEPEDQLADRLRQAETQVMVGGHYVHYKQLKYKVLALALCEEDAEPCVVYQAEYGDKITWIRPITSWIEEVEIDGQKVPRFKKIREPEV